MKSKLRSIILIVSVMAILSVVPVFAGQEPVTYTASMLAKTGTFKASKKAKYDVKLVFNDKPAKGIKVTIRVGKNKYTAKTNKKGIATFKMPQLSKKGRYTFKVSAKIGIAMSGQREQFLKLKKDIPITVKK